jgi:hypothetical protein
MESMIDFSINVLKEKEKEILNFQWSEQQKQIFPEAYANSLKAVKQLRRSINILIKENARRSENSNTNV